VSAVSLQILPANDWFMDDSERIAVPVVDPSSCLRPRRRGQRRGFLAKRISGRAPATASSNRGGAPEAGVRAKKERAAKRMPTFRDPKLLYQLQVAIPLTPRRKIKHQGRPALTGRPLISLNRGLKAGQQLIDGHPATMLTTSVCDPPDTRACARTKRATCLVPSEHRPRKGDTQGHLEVLLQVEGEVSERMLPGWAMLHDPAATWIWSQEEIEDGALKLATPDELIGFFLPLRDLNQASGAVQRSGLR
jgi:hypothetical protein